MPRPECNYQKSINSPALHGFLRQKEAVSFEDGSTVNPLEKIKECAGGLHILSSLEHHSALFETRIGFQWNFPIRAGLFHGRSAGQRERNDTDIGAARLYELCRLRDVLAQDQLVLDCV